MESAADRSVAGSKQCWNCISPVETNALGCLARPRVVPARPLAQWPQILDPPQLFLQPQDQIVGKSRVLVIRQDLLGKTVIPRGLGKRPCPSLDSRQLVGICRDFILPRPLSSHVDTETAASRVSQPVGEYLDERSEERRVGNEPR